MGGEGVWRGVSGRGSGFLKGEGWFSAWCVRLWSREGLL